MLSVYTLISTKCHKEHSMIVKRVKNNKEICKKTKDLMYQIIQCLYYLRYQYKKDWIMN